MRILVVSPFLPVPATCGSAVRLLNLVKGLSRSEDVDLITIDSGCSSQDDVAVMKSACRQVFLASWKRTSKLRQLPRVLAITTRVARPPMLSSRPKPWVIAWEISSLTV